MFTAFNRKQVRPKRAQSGSRGKPDMQLLGTILLLSIFGAIMVYSGSVIVAVRQGNTPSFYFTRQLIWIFLGLILAFVTYRFDYHILPKFALWALVVTIMLLVIVLIANQGQLFKRWIDLGSFELQPSEIAKITFLIYLSCWLSKPQKHIADTKKALRHHVVNELAPFLVLLAGVSLLILLEPDLDTTVIIGATSFVTYFVSGNGSIHFFTSMLTGLSLVVVGYVASLLANYRLSRLSSFFEFWRTGTVPDPYGAGYQLQQILVAVASGGLFGVGFGESRQKFNYLGDTAFSDTIFAIFAEEFGLLGSLILIGAFIFLMFKGYAIAKNAPDKLGFLLAFSITTWITLQAFFHIAANVALVPINGNTLPFISYGGSSTVINLAAMGLLLNISSHAKNKRKLA